MSDGNEKTAERQDTAGRRDGVEKCRPRDVIDGVPDRSADPKPWKYVALAIVFLAWVAFLLVCGVAGRP